MTDDLALLRAHNTFLEAKCRHAEQEANELRKAKMDWKAMLDALNEENVRLRAGLRKLRDKTTVNSSQIELINTVLGEPGYEN